MNPTTTITAPTTFSAVPEHRVRSALGAPVDWRRLALCAQVDPELFFPEKGTPTREARRVCTGCEVRTECLADAMASEQRYGVWGGVPERRRRGMLRAARAAARTRSAVESPSVPVGGEAA